MNLNKLNPAGHQLAVGQPVVKQLLTEPPVADFVSELNRKNIQLWVEGASLRYKAPKGEMTPEIMGFIKERRAELIQYLQEQARGAEEARAIFYEPIPKAPLKPSAASGLLEYPLSSAQKRMFIAAQLNPEQTGYNLTQVLKLVGTVQLERIQVVIAKLIERHEILRTSFEPVEGNLVQRIHPSLDFTVEYMETNATTCGGDTATESDATTEGDVEALIHQFIRPYDLKEPPLFRVRLVKLNGFGASGVDTYLLLYDIHHIISDGVSLGIFTKEVNSLYAGQPLPPAPVQYKDYTLWHEKLLQSDVLKQQKEHWLKQFQGEIPVINLLPDYPRPPVYRFDGAIVKQWIDRETAADINRLARENQATLYQVLFSAYFILLARLSGQSDLVVGTPTAGRRHADLNEVMGMFVNTLAIRSFPAPEKTFRGFLEEVSQGLLEAFDNQDYPFEALVEELKIERDLSRNPLFDTMFVLQNMELEDLEIPGLKITPYEFDNSVAKFDLTLTVTETGRGIYCKFEYCTALFKRETIERLAGYFRNLLEAVTADPDIRLDRVEILTAAERNQILYEFNDTRADYPKETIHRLFEEQAERTPDQIAVIFNEKRLTYRELNRKANQMASRLRSMGARPDSIIAIIAERTLEMIIAILSVLKAGGAYLPIDPEYPEERIGFMLKDGGVSLLLTQRHLMDKKVFQGAIIDLDDETIYYGAGLNSESQAQPRNLAYIIYTSGTTGKPKGAMIEHRNVVRLLFNEKMQFDFNANDTWTMFHSFCFDFSVWEMYGALLNGGQLIMVPKSTAQDPREYLKLLKERRVTVLNQTPTAFYNLVNEELTYDDHALALRYVIFGGEALQPGMLKEWRKKYPWIKLINMYGITETTVHVTYKEITSREIELNISNIGKPIPTLTAYITDRELRLQPIGVPGELCVGGDGVGRGYLNRPELTAEKLRGGVVKFID
jgi:amino acid adenylation domain-containing protein